MNLPHSRRNPRWQGMAVVAFCAWQASDLVAAWRHSPHDRLGWLALVLWLLPLVPSRTTQAGHAGGRRHILAAALSTAFLGRLLDINAVACAGLALSLAALAPVVPRGRRLAWLAGSVSWMPLLGWLAHDLPRPALMALRLGLATAAAAAIMLPFRPQTVRSSPSPA